MGGAEVCSLLRLSWAEGELLITRGKRIRWDGGVVVGLRGI